MRKAAASAALLLLPFLYVRGVARGMPAAGRPLPVGRLLGAYLRHFAAYLGDILLCQTPMRHLVYSFWWRSALCAYWHFRAAPCVLRVLRL